MNGVEPKVCIDCGGTGVIIECDCDDVHHSCDESRTSDCDMCWGTGNASAQYVIQVHAWGQMTDKQMQAVCCSMPVMRPGYPVCTTSGVTLAGMFPQFIQDMLRDAGFKHDPNINVFWIAIPDAFNEFDELRKEVAALISKPRKENHLRLVSEQR